MFMLRETSRHLSSQHAAASLTYPERLWLPNNAVVLNTGPRAPLTCIFWCPALTDQFNKQLILRKQYKYFCLLVFYPLLTPY